MRNESPAPLWKEETIVTGMQEKRPGRSGPRWICVAGAIIGMAAVIPIVVVSLAPGAGAADAGPRAGRTSASGSDVEVRLPADIVFDKTAGPSMAVVFRHGTHVALAGGKCVGCHPEPFKLLHPVRRTSHAEMNAGRSCGTCHDGRQASGTADQTKCQVCHVGTAKTPPPPETSPPRTASASGARQAAPAAKATKPAPAAAGPPDVALRQGAGSPGAVTFRHSTHAAAGLRCDQCHPAVFAMQASATPLPKAAMREGKTCGSCHDGTKAFGLSDGAQCLRCHTMGRAGR